MNTSPSGQERRGRRTKLPSIDRRTFLQAGAAVGGLALLGLDPAAPASAQPAVPGPGRFGSLLDPDANGFMLPPGFSSRLIAEQGVPLGASGYVWHDNPDGGSVFPLADGHYAYASNSESTPGGTGVVRFDPDGEVTDAYRILDGTRHNCAGGATPWGTWLSCEENFLGHVFECPVDGPGNGVQRPLLGAFEHEAVAVDPVDHRLYLTEDSGSGRFYRFTPARWRDDGQGVLEAGTLEAMAVAGDPGAGDGPWDVTWVFVDPLLTEITGHLSGALGATPFDGGEGCWYDHGRVFFTTKGNNRVWALDIGAQQLHLLYDAGRLGDAAPLKGVDNATVSPFGDLFVAEDGGNMELVALSDVGGSLEVTPFLRVTGQDGSELAGPAFHPAGDRLYLSSQRGAPGRGRGLTYEIRGPFDGSAALAAQAPTTTTAPIVVTTPTVPPSPSGGSLLPTTGGDPPLGWAAAALGAGLAAIVSLRRREETTHDGP